MKKSIRVLDCTLRDGGLGMEDAYISGVSDAAFCGNDVDSITRHLVSSNIDIIELGSIEITNEDKSRFAIYQSIEDISNKMTQKTSDSQMFAALYRGPDTPICKIPEWKPNLCKAVRVIIRYSELQKSLDFCKALSHKGYKVFVQPMLTMRYSDSELLHIIRSSNEMKAYALYIVDSYGYMSRKDVIRLFNLYNNLLDREINIGFHSHNNMNLAFSNVLSLLEIAEDRKVIIDSCAIGMGQGAGNMQTEILVDYLNKNYNSNYNFSAILHVCEIVERLYGKNLWGYSVTRLLPALHRTAYKYALCFRNKYKLSFVQIEEILSKMPDNMRNRYTTENAAELVGILQ